MVLLDSCSTLAVLDRGVGLVQQTSPTPLSRTAVELVHASNGTVASM